MADGDLYISGSRRRRSLSEFSCLPSDLLREAAALVRWGMWFKQGRRGVRPNRGKALESFLKEAACGSTAAMVDADFLYWEMGKREEAARLYGNASELCDA